MKGRCSMMHWLLEASLIVLVLSSLTGCTTIMLVSTDRGLSSTSEIPHELTKLEIKERFGASVASGTTSLGRPTETHRIRMMTNTGNIDATSLWWFVGCGVPMNWPLCATYLAVDTAMFPFVYREIDASRVEVVFVYGEDGRLLYSYNERAAPSEKYGQALLPMKHPLYTVAQGNCPKLKVCFELYIEEAHKRAKEVGYRLSEEDEKTLHKDLETVSKLDEGKMTKEEAFRLTCASHGYSETRKPPLPRDLYDAMNKSTHRLLDEVKDGPDSMSDAVVRYVENFRNLMTGFTRTPTCADEEIFQQEVEIAKDTDVGKLTREEALSTLQSITTRHLIDLYFSRSRGTPVVPRPND